MSSAMPVPAGAGEPGERPGETLLLQPAVVVRRNAGLAALIGAGASGIAIAYLWRASQSGLPLDWALCAVLAGIAAFYLSALVDSRTPLLVADDLGVRIRLGIEWRGLPWDAIEQVSVQPRRGLLRDGRLVLAPRNEARALDGLDRRARRHAALNQKMYGAALAVPVALTTRLSTAGDADVADELAALARGRAQVTTATRTTTGPEEPGTAQAAGAAQAAPAAEPTHEPAPSSGRHRDPAAVAGTGTGPRRRRLGGIAMIVSRAAKRRSPQAGPSGGAVCAETAADDVPAPADPAVSWPLRSTRPALRAQVTRDLPASLGNVALQPSPDQRRGADHLPEGRELRRPGSVDLVFEAADPAYASGTVHPIARLGESVAPLVIDDYPAEPAPDPVIGPELAAARTRVGLTVDELAERTRIRPHVIESIEVDDFAPCGGDFYARGHLRTLARVLGQDPVVLLEIFDNRYASAPVNARRVFEAELATGMTGSMRSTLGGPNWGLLIGAVLSLVLVWGVVRLFAGPPVELTEAPAPVLHQAVSPQDAYPGAGPAAPASDPLSVTLVAAHAGAHVVVRNSAGMVVFAGDLVLGEKKKLEVTPPVRVSADNAGAIEVQVRGRDRGVLGELDKPGRRTFHAPSR